MKESQVIGEDQSHYTMSDQLPVGAQRSSILTFYSETITFSLPTDSGLL